MPQESSTVGIEETMTSRLSPASESDALRSGRRGRTFESCRPDYEGEPAAAVVVAGESNADYHGDREHWSTSQLKDYDRGVAWFHRRHILRIEGSYSSDALQYGTLFHTCMELGPEDFWARASEVPPQYCTASGAISAGVEARKWRADLPSDALLISPADADMLRKQLEQFFANAAVAELYSRIQQHEISIRWTRGDLFKLRCRPDAVLDDGRLIDFKTTSEPRILRNWWKSAVEFGYGLQAAVYGEGSVLAGLSDEPMVFIVVSTKSPFDVQAVTLPSEFVDAGRRRMQRIITEIQQRMEMDHWLPEGFGEVVELSMPSHALRGDA